MDKDYIWATLLEHIAKTCEDTCSHIRQVLPLLHYVQIEIRFHIEYLKHLIKHLAVLPGDADYGFKFIRAFLELLDERAHLDCLRTSSEDQHYFFHVYLHF